MGLRINTNQASGVAWRGMASATRELASARDHLSSGLRITVAADDPSGLGISERMRARIASHRAAGRGIEDGRSLAQTAEGALGQVADLLVRMRELALTAASGQTAATDRQVLDLEFQAAKSEIARLADQTAFNGARLLDGSQGSFAIQVGVEAGETVVFTVPDASPAALGLGASAQIRRVRGAKLALKRLDQAIDAVSSARGTIGAALASLGSAADSSARAREALSVSEHRIRDADWALESSRALRASILQLGAAGVLAQASLQPALALELLR